jgi:phosphoribosylformylglycinamidine cyclo-ligase
MAKAPIRYSDFVDYSKLDPVKEMALRLFEPTLSYPERLDIIIVPETLGSPAIGFDYRALKDNNFITTTNVEGLGTKNLIADSMYNSGKIIGAYSEDYNKQALRRLYNGLGQCTAAMSVNDNAYMGSDIFSYHDIISCGNSEWFSKDLERTRELLQGYRTAADIGQFAVPQGETPELRGVVNPDTLDLAGSATGIIHPASLMVKGDKIQKDDVIYGLSSSGIHANGLSKARKIAESLEDGYFTRLPNGKTLGEELLTPTKIYSSFVREILPEDVHYMQPITGHGWEKIARYSQKPFTYSIVQLPEPPLVFNELVRFGGDHGFDISDKENYYVWNMGVGWIVIAPWHEREKIALAAYHNGLESYELGSVVKGPRRVLMPFEDKGEQVVYTP